MTTSAVSLMSVKPNAVGSFSATVAAAKEKGVSLMVGYWAALAARYYEGPFMSVKRLPNSSIKVVARNSTTNHDSRTAVPRKSNRCIMGAPQCIAVTFVPACVKRRGVMIHVATWMKQK